jgi:hypothetical protein
MQGSGVGSGSIPMTSGSGSRRPKIIWIWCFGSGSATLLVIINIKTTFEIIAPYFFSFQRAQTAGGQEPGGRGGSPDWLLPPADRAAEHPGRYGAHGHSSHAGQHARKFWSETDPALSSQGGSGFGPFQQCCGSVTFWYVRIRGSVPLYNGSGSESCKFIARLVRSQVMELREGSLFMFGD